MIIIGDIHEQYEQYCKIARQYEYSLQIGDFGFNYECLKEFDPNKTKIIKGNHDNYSIQIPHDLGDYGITNLGGCNLFYVRGGFSIDYKRRTPGLDWFYEEELNIEQIEKTIDLYSKTKPDILISHEGPFSLLSYFPDRGILQYYGYKNPLKTRTNLLLDQLINIHKPKLHIFGHMHHSLRIKKPGIQFIALNILETYVI